MPFEILRQDIGFLIAALGSEQCVKTKNASICMKSLFRSRRRHRSKSKDRRSRSKSRYHSFFIFFLKRILMRSVSLCFFNFYRLFLYFYLRFYYLDFFAF